MTSRKLSALRRGTGLSDGGGNTPPAAGPPATEPPTPTPPQGLNGPPSRLLTPVRPVPAVRCGCSCWGGMDGKSTRKRAQTRFSAGFCGTLLVMGGRCRVVVVGGGGGGVLMVGWRDWSIFHTSNSGFLCRSAFSVARKIIVSSPAHRRRRSESQPTFRGDGFYSLAQRASPRPRPREQAVPTSAEAGAARRHKTRLKHMPYNTQLTCICWRHKKKKNDNDNEKKRPPAACPSVCLPPPKGKRPSRPLPLPRRPAPPAAPFPPATPSPPGAKPRASLAPTQRKPATPRRSCGRS